MERRSSSKKSSPEIKAENKLSGDSAKSKRSGINLSKEQYHRALEEEETVNPAKSRTEAPSHPVDQDSQVTLLREEMQNSFNKIQNSFEEIQKSFTKVQQDHPMVQEEIKQIRQDILVIGDYLQNIKQDYQRSLESINSIQQNIKNIEKNFANSQKLDPTRKSLMSRTVDFLTKDVLYPIIGATIYVALVSHFTKPANALQMRDTHDAELHHKDAPPYSFRSGDIPISSDFESQYKKKGYEDIPSMRLFDPVRQRPVEVPPPTVADIEHLVQHKKFPELFLSMCQQQEILTTAVKNKVFRDSFLLPILQDGILPKLMLDLCEKPEFKEALASVTKAMEKHRDNLGPLLDDKLFKYNLLSALQENRQEKASSPNLYTLEQCIEVQKVIAPNSPSDNHNNEYYHEPARRKSGYREETPYPKPLDQTVDRAVESFFGQTNLQLYMSYAFGTGITILGCYIWVSLDRTVKKSTKAAKESVEASKAAKEASSDNRLLIGELRKLTENNGWTAAETIKLLEKTIEAGKDGKKMFEAIKQHSQAIHQNTQDTKNTVNETHQIFKEITAERARMVEQAAAERARMVEQAAAERASSNTIKNRPLKKELKIQEETESE